MKVLISQEKIEAIADAIREKTGAQIEMTLDEMPALIRSISGGSSITIDTDEEEVVVG